MRTFTMAAAVLALLAAPAHAQKGSAGGGGGGKTPQQLIDEQKRKEAADIDRQYENRLKGPAADVKDDPWRTVCPAAPANQKR